MVSLDEYYYEVPNINILRNVIEAHAEDYRCTKVIRCLGVSG